MNKEYYQENKEEVIKKLNSSLSGLKEQEAITRLKKDGYNELPKKKNKSKLQIFLEEYKDPIVIILIVAAILSFFSGEIIDSIVILLVITIDALVGTFQEVKAEHSAESLQELIKVETKVLRDKEEKLIESKNLVKGDIVLLESGDKISADIRIIECRNLTVDESVLTGESINSIKNSNTIEKIAPLSDRKNILYAGTSVITGRAKGVVIQTAEETEIGKIAHKVINTTDTKSPLTIRMEKFSKQITLLIIIIAILVGIVMLYKGENFQSMFLSVVALSVSAMPEGLPLALTMALTVGSTRMAKKNVIVKKLKSVESLGSCTVIASDKTGTLTVNEQTAKKIVLPDNQTFDIEGSGYNNNGKIIPIEQANIEYAKNIAILGALNNEAKIKVEKGKEKYIGDSIDIAFLSLGQKAKINIENIEIIDKIPYESEQKYSATFFKKDNISHITVKGAVDVILDFCNQMTVEGKKQKIDKEKILSQNEQLAKSGYRVIALAEGINKNFIKKETYDKSDIKNLSFLGLVAFIDPIRKESKKAIQECKTAGIKVVMITGDHPLTAYKIANDLDLVTSYNEVATTEQLDEYFSKSEESFDEFVKTKKVFTRVTPIQKLHIVESFKRMKEFVAVTGDGVNDAPAIKAANVGIAMGSGTDVAKETASMIITDDNFMSIVLGIKEGRTAYSNIRKVVYFLLSCGVAEVLFFLLAIIFNLPMPLIAIQLLWLNVVTDGIQDMALSLEVEDDDIMKVKPRKTTESIFNKRLIEEILIAGSFIGLLVFFIFKYLIDKNVSIQISRSIIMTLMVFIQNMHVLNCRNEYKSIFKVNSSKNKFILFGIISSILLQIIVIKNTILSTALKTTTINLNSIILLFIISISTIIVMEIYKKVKSKLC